MFIYFVFFENNYQTFNRLIIDIFFAIKKNTLGIHFIVSV